MIIGKRAILIVRLDEAAEVGPQEFNAFKVVNVMKNAPASVGADANDIRLRTREYVAAFDQVMQQPLLPLNQAAGQPKIIQRAVIRMIFDRNTSAVGNDAAVVASK